MPRQSDFKQTLCADINGFSLHDAVRCGADDRQALEQQPYRGGQGRERGRLNFLSSVVRALVAKRSRTLPSFVPV